MCLFVGLLTRLTSLQVSNPLERSAISFLMKSKSCRKQLKIMHQEPRELIHEDSPEKKESHAIVSLK
jgi:hypothetical protein